MRLYFYFLCLLLFPFTLRAQAATPQSGAPQSAAAKSDSGGEAAIYDEINTTATYEADGTGTYQNSTRVHIQSSAGVQQFGVLSFPYQKNFQDLTINYVRVRKPDGNVIATPLTNVQDLEAEVTREAPFYSDLRNKQVAVKGLGAGDVLEWSSTTRIFKALAPNQFWLDYDFSKNVIVHDEELRLNIPEDLYVNVKSRLAKPEVREQDGRKIYTWTHSQPTREKEDLKEKYASPFRERQNDVQISTFHTWQEVGDWYSSLQQDRVKPSDEVRAKAADLTKDAKTEDEKLHILYNFVAANFRYIGIAFGIGRYQPHSAADVLDNSYGDCKDKDTLLESLLDSVGIHSTPALVSSGFDIDPDVPSPGQFDHVITAVHRGGDLVWLDTTTEVAPFGLLIRNVRGKQALVVATDHGSRLVKIPLNPPFTSLQEISVKGKLSAAGELQASFAGKFRGDPEVLLRLIFHRVPEAQWKDLVQQMSQNLGYAGTVSNVTASNPQVTGDPFQYSYDYDRTDYSDWVNNKRITPPLPPLAVSSLDDEYEKSGDPVRLGTPGEIKYTSEITLPSGYTPQLPESVDIKTDFAEYQSKYSIDKGVLHASRMMRTLMEEIPASEYSKYRDFSRKVSDDTNDWITFSSNVPNSSTPSTTTAQANWPPGFPPPPDTEAGRVFRDGIENMRSRQLNEALDKFEKAAKLDPKLPGIWFAVGAARFATKDVDGGIEALRRQTQETPKEPAAWRSLGFALLGMKRTQDALPVLQKWYEIAPNDRDSAANLARALIALKRYKEAIAPLEKAAELNPDSGVIQYELGSTYLGLNNFDDAAKHYAQSIQLTLDPAAYENNAAYSLAARNAHLDDAETWAKDAVQVREKDTLDINSIDDLDSKHLRMMSELAAYWDTLGYIYYLRGDYQKAESYIRSSWDLEQDSPVAEHLGEVYEKMHEPTKAVRFYSLSANAANPSADVQDKLFRLLKQGVAEPANWEPREELGRIRSLNLPPLTKKMASAEFLIVLTNRTDVPPPVEKLSQNADGKSVTLRVRSIGSLGKAGKGTVKQIKFISGSEELRSADQLLREKDLLTEFPDDSPTNIFRRGILTCAPDLPHCQFTLLTVDSVHSAN